MFSFFTFHKQQAKSERTRLHKQNNKTKQQNNKRQQHKANTMADHRGARKFLVAVDASENSKWAFNYATSVMDKHNDEIHLLTVRQEPSAGAAAPFGLHVVHEELNKMHEEEKRKSRRLLRTFAKICHELGITTKLHLSMGRGEVGHVICSYVKEHHIDFLVMGRRGMGAVERFFLGSHTKHCIEEADCNIVIIKHAFGPEIVHDTTVEDVHKLEEEERQWRIQEYERKLAEEKKAAEEESKKDLEKCHELEEEERHRREVLDLLK